MLAIQVKSQFIGFHRYKNAPENVKFLRSFHRHIFYVTLACQVNQQNREVEFFTLKEKLERFINKNYNKKSFEKSCELIALEVATYFEKYKPIQVEVSEDGESEGVWFNSII